MQPPVAVAPYRPAAPVAFAAPAPGAPRRPVRRRSRLALPALASFATAAMVLVIVVDPYSGTYANAAPPAEWEVVHETQDVVVADGYAADLSRDTFAIEEPPPPPPPPPPPVVVASSGSSSKSAAAPAAGNPDPGSAKATAKAMLEARGWNSDQYNCLVSLWNKESGWNMYAQNKSSGAYGIPQALPGSKMASAGSDWATNAATQISWGLGYISGRYQTPCGAWTHSQAVGWY
ncbi:MAG: lytic transglycosylase domain-containing protein [Glaciihabitans sp.]